MSLRGSLQMFTIIYLLKGSDAPPLGSQVVPVEGCEGQDKLMLTEDYAHLGKILYYEWYYNITNTICINKFNGSEVGGPYKSKVEQCNTAGILLKNLSLNDSGEYTLKAVIEKMPEELVTKIYLNVFVSPTKQCRPHISYHSDNSISCSTSCGYIHGEWRLDKTGSSVLNGSLSHISCPWKGELVSCCLQVQNMKCQEEDKSELCLSVNISSCTEESSIGNGPEIDTAKVPSSSNKIDWWAYLIIGAVIIIIIICFMVFIIYHWWMKRKKRQENVVLSEVMEEAFYPFPYLSEEIVPLAEVKQESDYTSVELSDENVPLSEVKEDADCTTIELSDKNVSMSEVMEEAYSPLTALSETEETKMASTDHEPSTNSENIKELKELQELRRDVTCKICLDKEMSVVFIPCKHMATCANCSHALKHCPVCRAIIMEKMNIRFD